MDDDVLQALEQTAIEYERVKEKAREDYERKNEDWLAIVRVRDLMRARRSRSVASNGDAGGLGSRLPGLIEDVLRKEQPLHYTEITKRLVADGIDTNKGTVGAAISRYMDDKYKRTSPGTYALIDYVEETKTP